MKTVCYISPSDRSAKFLVGNKRGAPPPLKSSFSAVQNVNAIQRDVVYILRNAYEIVLYRKRHNIRGKLAVR